MAWGRVLGQCHCAGVGVVLRTYLSNTPEQAIHVRRGLLEQRRVDVTLQPVVARERSEAEQVSLGQVDAAVGQEEGTRVVQASEGFHDSVGCYEGAVLPVHANRWESIQTVVRALEESVEVEGAHRGSAGLLAGREHALDERAIKVVDHLALHLVSGKYGNRSIMARLRRWGARYRFSEVCSSLDPQCPRRLPGCRRSSDCEVSTIGAPRAQTVYEC